MQKVVPIGRRIGQIFAIGGIPGAMVGGVGDFFSPHGGWLFAASIGVIVLTASILMLLIYAVWGDRVNSLWPLKFIAGDPEQAWIVQGNSPWGRHIVHLGIVFAAASILIAQKSQAASNEGGLIAKNFDLGRAMQSSLGIQSEILEEQKKAAEAIERIEVASANFKKEVSDDPKKELANMGVPYTASGLLESVANGDARAVDLFQKSGIRPNDFVGAIVDQAIKGGNVSIINSIRKMNLRPPYTMSMTNAEVGCIQIAETYRATKPDSRNAPVINGLFSSVCRTGEMVGLSKESIEMYENGDADQSASSSSLTNVSASWARKEYEGALVILGRDKNL